MSLIIYGKNPCISAIKDGNYKKIYIQNGFQDQKILSLLERKNIKPVFLNQKDLDKLTGAKNSQGIAVELNDIKKYTLDDIIEASKIKNSFVIVLDGIEDPHNFGAILRVADAFSSLGVIIKTRGQVPLNSTVAKVSTGAFQHVKVVEVNNLNNALDYLKKNGFWVVSSDGSAKQSYDELNYDFNVALVIGSEGFGISNLILRNSDFIVKINMLGHVNSLNASNATAVISSYISLKQN